MRLMSRRPSDRQCDGQRHGWWGWQRNRRSRRWSDWRSDRQCRQTPAKAGRIMFSALATALALSACGGGGDSSSGGAQGGAPTGGTSGLASVPADAEYAYYDLGPCGPLLPSSDDVNARPDLAATTSLCGLFKVPTLRNIALTSPYFHNGVFSNLHQVVQWYVTRDVNNNSGNNPNPVTDGPGGNPYASGGTFYTAADGSPDLFEYNDLPTAYDANVNAGEVPYTPPTFAGGQSPTLTAAEIDAVVAFLCTLTDGFDPDNPAAYNVPAQRQPVSKGTAQ